MELLLEVVRKARIFRRNKVFCSIIRVRAYLLCMSGLSFRCVPEFGIPGGQDVVRRWVHRFAGLPSLLKPKVRRAIAVDETKLKVNGQHLFVWAAIDVDSREVLAVDASWQRSIMNAGHILKKALRSCLNKPVILVDNGSWYHDALKNLRLKWKHVTRGLRNRIERWFRTLKERTRRFYNNMNARKLGILSMKLFLNLYTYYYNNLRTHQTLGKPPSR